MIDVTATLAGWMKDIVQEGIDRGTTKQVMTIMDWCDVIAVDLVKKYSAVGNVITMEHARSCAAIDQKKYDEIREVMRGDRRTGRSFDDQEPVSLDGLQHIITCDAIQIERRRIWVEAWTNTARSSNCVDIATPTKFADVCLANFDARFGTKKA